MLIAMAGLPGTGKSTLAQSITHTTSGVVLNKDTVRAALFPPDLIEYSTEQDDFCMSILFQVATYMLQKNPQQYAILDGRTFSHHYQVLALKQLATQLQTPLKIIECVCSDETAYKRLAKTTSGSHPADNRDYTLYLMIKARFEAIREPKLIVNTDNDLDRCLRECLAYIQKQQ